MRSCDTNILLYAFDSSCAENARARSYLERVSNDQDFAICELVLVELYVLLRQPRLFDNPLSAPEAADYCLRLRRNPHWRVVDYNPLVTDELWQLCRQKTLPVRGIFDLRLALTLKHHGIDRFATRNTKDFERFKLFAIENPID